MVETNLSSILDYKVFRPARAPNFASDGTALGTVDSLYYPKEKTNPVGRVVPRVDILLKSGVNVLNINLDPIKRQGTSLRSAKTDPVRKQKTKGVSSFIAASEVFIETFSGLIRNGTSLILLVLIVRFFATKNILNLKGIIRIVVPISKEVGIVFRVCF